MFRRDFQCSVPYFGRRRRRSGALLGGANAAAGDMEQIAAAVLFGWKIHSGARQSGRQAA